MSAQVAATVMGRPRMEPELSSNRVTTVSRKVRVLLALERERLLRVDDDARQARRIQHAFLEIELPGPVLLRHQAALQPVGKSRDDARQVVQLLVEIGPEPLEFLRVAELLGRYHLVELRREGLVVRAAGIPDRPLRSPALGRLFGLAVVGVLERLPGRRVWAFHGALLHVLGGGLGGIHFERLTGLVLLTLAVGLAGIVRRLVVGRVLVVILAIEAGRVGHLQGLEELVDRAPEGALILDRAIEPIEVGTGPLLDPGAPKVDDRLRRGRGRPARQAFAHHHGDRIFDRRIGPIRDVGEVAAVVAILQHGREVRSDALHASRPDGLDADLLHRLEHGARRLGLGQQPAMGRGIVASELQRHAVGMAPDDRRLARVELARRLRQPRLGGLAEPRDAGLVGRETHLQLRRPGHGPHAGRDSSLEGLLRGFGRRRGLAVGGEAHRLFVT